MIAYITVLPDADDVKNYTVDDVVNVQSYSNCVLVVSKKGPCKEVLSIPIDNLISINIEK